MRVRDLATIEYFKTDRAVPCAWCTVDFTYHDGHRVRQRLVDIVHVRTGEHRQMWLCGECLTRSERTAWLGHRLGQDAEAEATTPRPTSPVGIRQARRLRRAAAAVERELARRNDPVAKVQAPPSVGTTEPRHRRHLTPTPRTPAWADPPG
jgi:hypothetical protein